MAQIRVGVIRGGPSSEYEVSLKTGASILKHLPPQFKKEDILITKQADWHLGGLPFHPANLANHIDVALLALHGEYGEDGQIQKLLESLGVPFSGSGSLSSAIGINKVHSKRQLVDSGVKMPRHVLVTAAEEPEKSAGLAFAKFAPPYVVKPADRGSSVGLFIVKTARELGAAIRECLKISDQVLVEEFIRGKEATCGVVEKMRGHDLYPLLPVQILPPPGRAFDYEAKYSGASRELCPGHFNAEEKAELGRLAALAHKKLGLRHYSRSDFIVSPRGIYYLETNTLPGLTEESLLPKELSACGINYPHFLAHLVDLALKKR